MRTLPRRPAATPRKRLVWSVLAALALGAMAAALVPRGYDAGWLLLAQDDPVKLADHAVAERLTPAVAEREIAAALVAGDVDLANSFRRSRRRARHRRSGRTLAARLEDANSTSASAMRNVGSFAHGLDHRRAGRHGRARRHRARRPVRVRRRPRRGARRGALRQGRADRRAGARARLRRHRGHGRHLCVARGRRAGAHRPVAGQGRPARPAG